MGVIREILLGMKGPREFSNVAFRVRSKRFNPWDLDVDCKGKRYLITGANGAIGNVVATEIAKRGGELHMVCRNRQSAMQVQSNIIKKTGNKDVHLHQLDLSESRKVYNFAKTFRDSYKNLDALIHIAGTRPQKYLKTSEGLEYTFAVNTLAPHIMTRLLTPILLEKYKGRILLTSSFSMYLTSLNAKDPQLEKEPFSIKRTYTHTKRQLVDLAAHYAEEYVDLFTGSCSPGWVESPFTADVVTHPQVRKMWRTPEEGADCLLWMSISDAVLSHPSGSYFQDRRPCTKHLPFIWTSITSQKSMQKFSTYMDQLLEKISTGN